MKAKGNLIYFKMKRKYKIIFNNNTKKYVIERTVRFLFIRFKSILSYDVYEPSFSEDGTDYILVRRIYEFNSYDCAFIFCKHHNLF